MLHLHERAWAALVLAVAIVVSVDRPSRAQDGGAKKAAPEKFLVQCKITSHFEGGKPDVLLAPSITMPGGSPGTIRTGSERTITIAPMITDTVFEGTSISVAIRKTAKGKYIFDVEGSQSVIESDGLRHTQVKKRSNRVVSPLDLDHKFIVPIQPATKTQKAVDLEFTVKRVKT